MQSPAFFEGKSHERTSPTRNIDTHEQMAQFVSLFKGVTQYSTSDQETALPNHAVIHWNKSPNAFILRFSWDLIKLQSPSE
jgi:hypothetical protein